MFIALCIPCLNNLSPYDKFFFQDIALTTKGQAHKWEENYNKVISNIKGSISIPMLNHVHVI